MVGMTPGALGPIVEGVLADGERSFGAPEPYVRVPEGRRPVQERD
jgi:hypothetical protein